MVIDDEIYKNWFTAGFFLSFENNSQDQVILKLKQRNGMIQEYICCKEIDFLYSEIRMGDMISIRFNKEYIGLNTVIKIEKCEV